MRLHVGNGPVLLRDWVNVDLPLPHVFLTKERPDLVERFLTSENDYYGRHADMNPERLRKGPVTGDTVCDVFGSFTFLPARAGSVSELLSRQCFEHLDRHEAVEAIQEAGRVLKRSGILRIDIPDPDETLRLYRETGDEFYIRHLFGPRRNMWGFHTHYTRDMLKQMVEAQKFKLIQEEPNEHFYPAFTMRFQRA